MHEFHHILRLTVEKTSHFVSTIVIIIHLTVVLFFIGACTSNHNFQGHLEIKNDESEELLLKSSSKYIDSIYSPLLSIVDSIALFYSTNNGTAYEAVKLSTGNKI